jgi:FixJ family two-component response regulator
MHSSLPAVAVVAAGETMRDALTASLSARGFRIDGYESLQAFLDVTRLSRPMCLIVDLASTSLEESERAALELRAVLRKHALSLPLILLAGHGEMARGGLALQPNLSILIKPVAPDLLSALVKRALNSPSLGPTTS